MADQTLPLNVSYEMKADDERQNCVGMESDEELYSSSTTDAYGCRANTLIYVEIMVWMEFVLL